MLFRHESSSIVVCAPAKLNLFLNVLGKRADGYHELETLMLTIGFSDTLRFSPSHDGGISLQCHDLRSRRIRSHASEDALPNGPDNLVVRAANLLRETTGTDQGAHIELFKRIPLAAGLAGGSTDAAATLLGLNRLWQLGLKIDQLHVLAARLGSDVPFFLNSTGAAICRGRGELIEPLQFSSRLHFVIARPFTGLSTALVFKHCRPAQVAWSARELADSLTRGRLRRAADFLHNSLQEPAEQLNADVSRLKTAFSQQPFLGHLMSGSGTSYFGICQTRKQALHIAARLKATRLGDVFVAQNRP